MPAFDGWQIRSVSDEHTVLHRIADGPPVAIGDKALLIPEGVPDLYISVFAPADYMETVNTQGIPYYSMIEPLPFNKGMAGEAQSNPLHLCTRPRAQILLEL